MVGLTLPNLANASFFLNYFAIELCEMKKNNCYILLFLILVVTPLFAQRETANWFFGTNAGLNFNTGIPETLIDGQISTTEGCSTVSDSSGELLFYTNGDRVLNKTHSTMSNGYGLLGHRSSSQSAIVVPNVSNPSIYYVFTADVVQAYLGGRNGNGFNYSVIDLSLNAGLGRVISKNINLIPQSSEKVSAVSALDGSGFWVVTHARNKFYAYKVDGSGVNSPVISTIGIDIDDYNNIRGHIKFSPNGKKLAITHSIFEPDFNGYLNIYDFNLNTGVVSNEKLIGRDRIFYGIEFSPDSSKLFTTAMLIDISGPLRSTQDIALYQYDTTVADIIRTEFLINTYISEPEIHLGGALQLAFDKKVYHSILGEKLSVINEPSLYGSSIDYREFSVDLAGKTTRFGLPSYEQSAFESIISVEDLCFNNVTKFNIVVDEAIQSISWDFGDPTSGVNNTSTDMNPTHLFSSTGRFTVTMNVNFVNRATKTYIEFIEIGEMPDLITQVELTQCDVDDDDGITKFNLEQVEPLLGLPSNDLVINYFESFDDAFADENVLNESNYENTTNGQIIFAKIFINAGCYSIIEVKLNVEPMSNLGEYLTIFVCQDNATNNLTFEASDILSLLENDFLGSDNSLYFSESDALLENNSISGTINFPDTDEKTLYFRIENLNACSLIGSIRIDGVSLPILEDKTSIFCSNSTNFLDADDGFWSYLWSTGETTKKIEISSPGSYWVEVFTGIDCSDIINFDVKLSEGFNIEKIEIQDFRPENTVNILLSDYSGSIEYSLDDGITFSESNYFENVAPGIYNVLVKKDNCHFVEETILVGGYPNFFTPNGDGINDIWKIKQPENFQEAKISIYNRYGKLLKIMNAFDGWDGKHEGNVMTPSDYWFSIALNEKIVFGHFTLKL